jgi:hypothetical protein
MEELPFKENYLKEEDKYERRFSKDLDETEMKWHFDEEDRDFEIIESDGWMFQRDNSMPEEMKPGMIFKVRAGEYHRGIIPENCKSDLVIKVKKYS